MNEIMTPLHFLIAAVAGWINEQQTKRIEFLCKQLEAYQRIAGTGRLPFTNKERSQIAELSATLFWRKTADFSTVLPQIAAYSPGPLTTQRLGPEWRDEKDTILRPSPPAARSQNRRRSHRHKPRRSPVHCHWMAPN